MLGPRCRGKRHDRREQKLNEVIAAYYQAMEAGSTGPPEFLARYRAPPGWRPSSTTRRRSARGRCDTPVLPETVRYFRDYELLEEIARGGMGVVYRARQVSLNRTVALKMIVSGDLASADDVARFRAEAAAAANLDHPNIVPIYEVGEHDGRPYFSMKLIEGGSLAGAACRPRYSRIRKWRLVATVACRSPRQRGIHTTDLKPGNILLDRDGQLRHGLRAGQTGRRRLAITQTGRHRGTPAPWPRQALPPGGLTTAADVYAWARSLRVPHRRYVPGRVPLETILQVLGREPERPLAINSAIDRDMETICLKCLEKGDQARVRRRPGR
jgi:serine/threonine-protein kinase